MSTITTRANRSAIQPKPKWKPLLGRVSPTPVQDSEFSVASARAILMPCMLMRPNSILLIVPLQYGQFSLTPALASLVSISSWQWGQCTKKAYVHSGQLRVVSGTCCLQFGHGMVGTGALCTGSGLKSYPGASGIELSDRCGLDC